MSQEKYCFGLASPVPLTPKTFQILLVLVRHGKEIVTKDDLMKKVWPDTFVEEANLSRNIFMLRKALGETAQDRQYIITVPGRGYRLTENVHLVPQQEFAIVAASHSTVQVHVKETKPWPWIVVVVFLFVVSVGHGGGFCIAECFSVRKTRLCSRTSPIPQTTPFLTGPYGRAWRCNLSSRPF